MASKAIFNINLRWPPFNAFLEGNQQAGDLNLQFSDQLTLSQISPGFYMSAVSLLKNNVEKGEIAHNEQFLLFPQCFSISIGEFSSISSNLGLLSANSLSLEKSKICCLEKG